MLNKIFKTKGFTLVELIVGISIFIFVAISILQLFIFTNKNSQQNKNVFIANGLASECIEVLTAMRDNNYLNNLNYNSGIYFGSDHTSILVYNLSNNSWSLDFGNDNNTENINSCSTNKSNYCGVYKDDVSGRFTQKRSMPETNLRETNFFRLIKIDSFTNYLKVSCYVTWKGNGVGKKIILEKDLWSWNN